MLDKILNDWSNKLWWVHSESLYPSILDYSISKDKEFLEIYNKLHNYVFGIFPHQDESIDEWIQIRNREGRPEEKIVALPVKDPFHIMRNFIYITQTLTGLESKT